MPFARQEIRRRSQDIATQALSYRSEREIVQARGQSIERIHFTDIDRARVRVDCVQSAETAAERARRRR
jgi:alkyl sulfatase BDS1-like metallo-beta-lactamase superfamily hydrolase